MKCSVVSWESEGCYQYSKMFHWEPEGHHCCTMSIAKVPFWFLIDYLWIVIAPSDSQLTIYSIKKCFITACRAYFIKIILTIIFVCMRNYWVGGLVMSWLWIFVCIYQVAPQKRNSRYSQFFRTLLWSTIIYFHLAG